MATKKHKSSGSPPLYIPGERYKWERFTEEGQEDDPIQAEVKIRKNLTNAEVTEQLTFEPFPVDLEGEDLALATEAREVEMREALAPFVVDWNMGDRLPSGEVVKADPPSVAGGQQFGRYLPDRIVNAIFLHIKFHSTGLVKAKSSTPREFGDVTTDESPSETTAEA